MKYFHLEEKLQRLRAANSNVLTYICFNRKPKNGKKFMATLTNSIIVCSLLAMNLNVANDDCQQHSNTALRYEGS